MDFAEHRTVQLFRKTEWFVSIFLIPVVTILLSFKAHTAAGFVFPPPWPDESSFVWQSVSFQEGLTLFAPQINSGRHIMWMPPGYFIVTGLLLKASGFSFETVRLFSWVYLIMAYLALLCLFRKSKRRMAFYLLISLVFLNSFCVVAGNVCRMETLLLVVVFAGLLLLCEERLWEGLAVVSLSLLIHPNGLYFFAVSIAWCFWKYRLKWPKPGKLGIFLVLCSCCAWLSYAGYVVVNRDSFVHDMKYQLSRKAGGAFLEYLLSAKYMVLIGLYIGAGLISLMRLPRVLPVIMFGAACLAARLFGLEMWYGVFIGMSVLLLFCAILEMAGSFLDLQGTALYRFSGSVVIALVLAMAGVARAAGLADLAPGYPLNLALCDMKMRPGAPYIAANEKMVVLKAVTEKLARSGGKTVSFVPSADGLLFYPASKGAFMTYDPVFEHAQADMFVIHKSHVGSELLAKAVNQAMKSCHAGPEQLVYERGFEQWYVVPRN